MYDGPPPKFFISFPNVKKTQEVTFVTVCAAAVTRSKSSSNARAIGIWEGNSRKRSARDFRHVPRQPFVSPNSVFGCQNAVGRGRRSVWQSLQRSPYARAGQTLALGCAKSKKGVMLTNERRIKAGQHYFYRPVLRRIYSYVQSYSQRSPNSDIFHLPSRSRLFSGNSQSGGSCGRGGHPIRGESCRAGGPGTGQY